MPLGREGPDDLVEHRDGQLGELAAAGAVAAQDLARLLEDRIYAVQRGFFVAVLRRQRLRRDAREQLDVEFPCCRAVRIARGEFAFEETQIDLQAGQAPLLQKVPDRKSTRLNSS